MDPVKVSIIPNSPAFLKNRLFSLNALSGSHAANKHWMYPFQLLRDEAARENIVLETCDLLRPNAADIVVFMDLPKGVYELAELKRSAPHVKTILFPIESPLGRRYVFSRSNHRLFDAVLSYNHLLEDGVRYFHFDLPAAEACLWREGKPYSRRKLASLICGKGYVSWKSGANVIRSGWRFSVRDWLDYAFSLGELLSTRRSLVAAFEVHAPGDIDVYGDGWNEKPSRRGLLRTIVPSSAKGRLETNKLNTIGNYRFNFCIENCRNDCGYISEKIFDALLGGAVPVYLGNRSVGQHIPPDCFVDAEDFKSPKQLIQFLRDCSEGEWQAFAEAGKRYLGSLAFRRFGTRAFVESVLAPIRALSASGGASHEPNLVALTS